MNNPETVVTLDTQDTGRRQAKQNITQKNLKDEQHGPYQPTGVNSGDHEG
jgi:hypothetical protein